MNDHELSIDTGGGAVVQGTVEIGQGDFAGRDLKKIFGDEVHGDKIAGHKIIAENVFVTPAEVKDIEELPPEPGNPPYKGLQVFTEQDASLFFGRDRLIARIVGRLHDSQFLAVVGASGSGKSSLLRAGIIPALRSGATLFDGSVPPADSSTWVFCVMKPGATPLQALADVLTRDESDLRAGSSLPSQMAQDAEVLVLAARKLLARQEKQHLLLVVDQFEELFTLCVDDAERRAFLDNLLRTVGPEANASITIIIALRADFYDACGAYDGLRQAVSQHQEYIGAMSRDEMFDAIVLPVVRSRQWKIQEGLAEFILDEVGQEPGALSLLSHALFETWERRRGHTVTLSGYREAGGVRGAIAKTADSLYDKRLTEDQQAIARTIFLRLTELGTSTQDTRRRARIEELTSSSSNPDQVRHVLDLLVEARLVVMDRVADTGQEVVEVAHEALIRHWQRLRDWLDEDRRLLRLRQGIQRAAADWAATNREDDSFLIHRDERLKQVIVLLNHPRITLDATERAYLYACQKIDKLEITSVEKAGWGVIFAYNADPAIVEALRPLLDHRREQITAKYPNHYHEFVGKRGYRSSETKRETKREFLARLDVGSTRPSADRMPYYLLIVGDPETIPFSFQYQLDMQYAVGRIHFDKLEDYAQYARSVVLAETSKLRLPQRVVVFAPQNPDDRATELAMEHLATPMATYLKDAEPDWNVERVFREEATKTHLSALLGGPDTPPLLFSCGHGMNFPSGHDLQLGDQGALLCQDWPGPVNWHDGIPQDFYYRGEDVASDARLLGSIFYFWSCFGAATPKLDNYSQMSFRGNEQREIAPYSFIAQLPKRLLSHPQGGALAVIGSVERKWSMSFSGETGENDLDVFLTTMLQLMAGYPVGAAMEYFNQRYTTLMAELIDLVERSQSGEINPYELASMWTATNDARNYIIVGDPAVRLRTGQVDTNEL